MPIGLLITNIGQQRRQNMIMSPICELLKAIDNANRGQIGVKKKILVSFEVITF